MLSHQRLHLLTLQIFSWACFESSELSLLHTSRACFLSTNAFGKQNKPKFARLLDDADLTRRYSFCYHLQLPVVKNHTSPKLIIFFPSESSPSFIWLDLDA
ncbi:hypothetical protein H9L39_12948 [Fusarium oxysporum f. sp. albedinis]|nr:hypothetical protein H9L39_12948 [Fusarium oxysporum f. sp. albedinis]